MCGQRLIFEDSSLDLIKQRLTKLYSDDADKVYTNIQKMLSDFKKKYSYISVSENESLFSEKDSVLILYADHISEKNKPTLKSLKNFLDNYVGTAINHVHILPFFPYSSDDGFSVIDFYKVRPKFGDWKDIRSIRNDYRLMFDFVLNHVSSKCPWFQNFLKGNKKYRDYFIAYDSKVDTSGLFRPRSNPVLTPFKVGSRTEYVWTTFSQDQIDLNYKNPCVLYEALNAFLFYIGNGAKIIRLDAVTFIWKELGTNSAHLPQAHEIVSLLRDIVNSVAPDVKILTETNVPHKDNISYFGDGYNEAHMVYNFPLPPLLLHTFINQDSSQISEWIFDLEYPSDQTTYFNFVASHDGIGLTPLKGLISNKEIIDLAENMKNRGGLINYRTSESGTPFPYEINMVYLDAIGSADAFMASQAVALSMKGVPGIYFNSLIGAHNWKEGVKKQGYNRAINRQKFDFYELSQELDSPTQKHYIYRYYINLLFKRQNETAFSPSSDQEVLKISPKLVSLFRNNNTTDEKIVALINVSSEYVKISSSKISQKLKKGKATNIIDTKVHDLSQHIMIKPYQVLWLK